MLVNASRTMGAMTSTTNSRTDLAAGCCSPAVDDVISADQAESLATALRTIADPTRLRLISMVAAHDGGEACVCDLTEPVGLSQPTVSHHLKILVEAGILTREQRGKWAYYTLQPDRLQAIADLVPKIRVSVG